MTEPLRDKLIRCGWVTNCNADTLVRLIERHYAALEAQPEPVGPTPTPDDFRKWWRETGSASPGPSPEMLLTANAWAEHWAARCSRAQPEPVGPTDEELIKPIVWMMDECVYDNDKGEIAESLRELIARWGRPAVKPVNDRAKPTKTDLTNLMHDFVLGGESAEDFSFDHIGYAHAVLARWGQQ